MTPEQNHKDYVSLKEFIEQRFIDLEKATNLAAENLKLRLKGLNQWREQNRNERSKFLLNDVYEAKHLLLETKIENLQKFMWILMGIAIAIEIVLSFIK